MHIYDKYTGYVECYTGCNKKILNKKYAKFFSLYVTITLKVHFTSFYA